MPIFNVFRRDGDTIRHFWASEMLYAPTEEGEDPRHVGTLEIARGTSTTCCRAAAPTTTSSTTTTEGGAAAYSANWPGLRPSPGGPAKAWAMSIHSSAAGPVGHERDVGEVAALGDDEAEVERRPGHPVGGVRRRPTSTDVAVRAGRARRDIGVAASARVR